MAGFSPMPFGFGAGKPGDLWDRCRLAGPNPDAPTLGRRTHSFHPSGKESRPLPLRPRAPGRAKTRMRAGRNWYNGYIRIRFKFDRSKNRVFKRKHGVSLAEARQIFDQAHLVDQGNDNPEQCRAIGWCRGRLCSVVFEVRRDADGEYCHLITAWKATKEEEQAYAENI